MQDRLQASLAGLEELQLLRHRHQHLVNEAKGLMDNNMFRRRSLDAELLQILGNQPDFCLVSSLW